MIRRLHEAPLPPWPGRGLEEIAAELDRECEALVGDGVLPADLVKRNRQVAEAALRPWTPAFIDGDLQITHVFVDGDRDDDGDGDGDRAGDGAGDRVGDSASDSARVTGIIDWSEASRGDALYDLATLTLGHEDRLDDLLAGYGTRGVDLDVIRGWWSLRSLVVVRWLTEHGFDPSAPGCEIDVLKARM